MQNLSLGGRKAEIRTRDLPITKNGYYFARVVLPYEWNITLFLSTLYVFPIRDALAFRK